MSTGRSLEVLPLPLRETVASFDRDSQSAAMAPHHRGVLTGFSALTASLLVVNGAPVPGAGRHPVPPPPPVPPTGTPAADQASQLVVPLQPDLDLVPKVEPDPQRGLAIRGLVRWRLPAQP